MATYEGSNGKVMIKSGASDTLTAIAAVRSWNVSLTRDTVEDTSMNNDGYRTHKKGLQSYSGSMEIVYDDTTSAVVNAALNPDTDGVVAVEFYPDESVAGTKFAGNIIITEFGVTASYDGLVTASVSFQGNGAPTTVKISA
jgi:predicted secreted protein